MTALSIKPITLVILDGFGHRADDRDNAIANAKKPHWDALLQNYPHTLIAGSGKCVGLPAGQMGNSEVGHLTIGAGRVIQQDLTRIDEAITTETFFHNPVLSSALTLAKTTKRHCHVMGLLSPGGVHSHELHIHALVKLARLHGLSSLYIHAFLDGRDTPPQSARDSIVALEAVCQREGLGEIVSVVGRYYAMDRDKRWDRIAAAYQLLVEGQAPYHATTALAGLDMAYSRGETDEFVKPTAIHAESTPAVTINDGDVLIFMNFRSDRAREITQSFVDATFNGFIRHKIPKLASFVNLAEYDSRFNLPIAFPPQNLQQLLGQYLSEQGLKQLRIAETEKYAHVTFFFNGGVETPALYEDRILIPSPIVPTYDLMPEMSALTLTDRLVNAILTENYDFIVCNYANPDMVGHTGDFTATVKAIEVIDTCIGKIVAAIKQRGGELIITADHGNAEKMFDDVNNQPHTAHTADPVPFVYLGRPAIIAKEDGNLADIAPTLLTLMQLPIPTTMTGTSLVKLV